MVDAYVFLPSIIITRKEKMKKYSGCDDRWRGLGDALLSTIDLWLLPVPSGSVSKLVSLIPLDLSHPFFRPSGIEV